MKKNLQHKDKKKALLFILKKEFLCLKHKIVFAIFDQNKVIEGTKENIEISYCTAISAYYDN